MVNLTISGIFVFCRRAFRISSFCCWALGWKYGCVSLSKVQRSLASTLMNFQLDCIGSSQTDDEIIIAGSLKEFGRLLCVIEDERDRMVNILF
ncbi:UNVERIFIED_CONTAM: Arhgap42 [Trichonephila clavipes]